MRPTYFPAVLRTACKVQWLLAVIAAAALGFAIDRLLAVENRQPGHAADHANQAKPTPPDAVRQDQYGDTLPPEASARLGTVRFRHAQEMLSLAYTPDGRYLVSGGWGGACVWEAATGELIRRLGTDLESPYGPAGLSPDGKLVAVGGWGEKMGGAVYEVATGRQLYRFGFPSCISRGIFSPDGKILTTFPRNDGALVLLDAATGKELRALKGHGLSNALAHEIPVGYSPDCTTLVTSSGDRTIRFWDPATGQEIKRIAVKDDEIRHLVLSQDSTMMASVAWVTKKTGTNSYSLHTSAKLRLWDCTTGKELRRLIIPPGKEDSDQESGPLFVAFTPDGKELFTGGYDNVVRVWDPATGKELRHFKDHRASLLAIAFSPDRKTFALVEGRSIRVLDRTTGRELAPTGGHRERVAAVVISPDGRTVATGGGWDKSIILWDRDTGRERCRLDGRVGSIHTLFFSADGQALFSAGQDKELLTWDPQTGRELRRYEVPGLSWRFGAAVSHDNKLLAAGGPEKTLLVLDLATGKVRQSLTNPANYLAGMGFTPDSRELLGRSSDGKLHRWDVSTGKHLERAFYDNLELCPFGIVISPDGRLITLGVQNSDFLPVADLATGREVCRFPLDPVGRDRTIITAAFSPDSRTLAWGGQKDNSVRLGEIATGKVRHQFLGHRGRVEALAWSAEGKSLVSAGTDTTALVWDLTGPLPTGRARSGELTEMDLAACWEDLRNQDAARAYVALRRLAADPVRTVPYLKRQLAPVPSVEEGRATRLIADLESKTFATRDAAARELLRLGEGVLPALHKALAANPPLETRRRIEQLIANLEDLSPQRLQELRAVEVLEMIATAKARAILQSLAQGVAEARQTREARATLDRLSRRLEQRP